MGPRPRWPRCCVWNRPCVPPVRLPSGDTSRADALPAHEIRLHDVSFAYPAVQRHRSRARARSTSISPSPPVRLSPSWARTAPGRPLSPSCCAGCTIRSRGRLTIDGVDLREFDLASWRARVTAVFQDFLRLELPLRDNVAPAGAPDEVVNAALEAAGAANLASLDTILARGIHRRHRSLGRPVAARRARPGVGRGHARSRRGTARRAHGATRRARGDRRFSIACWPRPGIAPPS